MPTVINNPSTESESSGANLIIGVVIALLLIALFFIYIVPSIRGTNPPANEGTNINVELPNPTSPNPTPAP